jgi:uncharacterized membrane protein
MPEVAIASAGRILMRPLHPTFVSFPITCLVGALLTDFAYWRTSEMMWADFSAWLISAGVILGWLAAILGIIDLAGRRYLLPHDRIWAYAIGHLVVLVLATFNMLIHTRDAWTSVVPWGIGLSAITVVILILTHWIGWQALYRREPSVVVVA